MESWLQCSLVLILGLCVMVTDSLPSASGYDVHDKYDVCSPRTAVSNPNTVFLPNPKDSTEVYINWTYNGQNASSVDCLLYFRTCLSCYIKVEPVDSFDYRYCQNGLLNYDDYDNSDYCVPNPTSCPYFFLFDADYKKQTLKRIFYSGSIGSYQSQSRHLLVFACGINVRQNISMRLRLVSEEKSKTISQTPFGRESDYNFTSPYFPAPYTKNSEYYKFELQALLSDQKIIVSFDDWLLSPNSYLQVEDSINADKIIGANPRPYIISTGSAMIITFYTGDSVLDSYTYLGFKAVTTFISTSYVPKVSTDCDRSMTSEGGYLRLTPSIGRLQDCIWIIKRLSGYDGVTLKVLKYDINNGLYDRTDDILDIRDGTTSLADLKLSVKPNDQTINRTMLQSRAGFYIRLRGSYSDGASVALVFAMYKNDCDDSSSYFKCDTGICISSKLVCDGYEHCEDKSDESPRQCGHDATRSSSSYPISIGVIIPLVVSVFLIIIMCVLIILIRRCRRMNAAAQHNRIPPGLHPAQSRNRHRRRRNRDVQMNVTLSSGEHPPSYDEVLQSTPIGYLNMAFTWSQQGLTQPPSYEEAVSPTTTQQNGSFVITTTANNVCRGETNNLQQSNSSAVLTTTISASLDPRADVSSSSSSEDATEHYSQLDISSSSDSSTENEHSMIARNNNLEHSRSVTNLNKVDKNSSGVTSQIGNRKYSSDAKEIQVVLESSSSDKLNNEGHGSVKPENSRSKEESRSSKNLSITDGKNQQNENEARARDSQSVHSSERRNESRSEDENYGFNRNGVSERDRQQGRERLDMYHKHKGKHSGQSGKEGRPIIDQGDYSTLGSNSLNIRPSRVSDSSRSQSCVDLSWGAGAGRLFDSSRSQLRDEDKRFSYAGAGDVSLARGSLDPFYNSRALIREKPLEHLDKYASQSSENLRDDYRARRYDSQHYKALNGQDGHVHGKYVHSPDNTGHFPRSKRNKSDLLGSDIQYPVLAPVQENLCDDDYETNRLPVNRVSHQHGDNKPTDKQIQDNSSKVNNKYSNLPQYRSSTEFEAGFSQAPPSMTQKASSLNTRVPNAVRPQSGPNSSMPSDKMAMTSYSQQNFTEDQRHFSHSQDSKRQQEPSNSRQNFKKSNDSQTPDIQESVKYAQQPTHLLRNYEDNGPNSKHEEIPQDREATVTKPKPPLRMHLQASQRPDRELSETTPKPHSQPPFTASQRPTPAPRSGIKKPQNNDNSRSESVHIGHPYHYPDRAPYNDPAQHRSYSGTRYSEEANPSPSSGQLTMNTSGQPKLDSQSRQNKRGDESSVHSSEQTSSRSHLAIQATNDDVFV